MQVLPIISDFNCYNKEVLSVKKQMPQVVRILLIILLLLSAVVYALFMPQMSAAGWQYNVDAGNYPQLFAAFAAWMRIGSVLLCAAVVLCLLGQRVRFWLCNVISLFCGGAGFTSCMIVLSRFMAYADQNFPGMGETMQPVSSMYRDRLLPMLLPFALLCVLCVWKLASYDVQVYRKQKREKRRRKNEEQAPKILSDE